MCVIIHCDTVRPSRECLETAQKRNADGLGFAYIGEDDSVDGTPRPVVRFEKGISFERLVDLVNTAPLPYVVHMRVATAGGVSKQMCHPFPITSDVSLELEGAEDSVLFHNGTFKGYEEKLLDLALTKEGFNLPAGPFSDTRGIAKLVHFTKNENFLNLLRDDKQTNRFCILDAITNGVRRYGRWLKYDHFTVFGSDYVGDTPGEEYVDGIYFSNDYWNKTSFSY